MKTFSFVKLSVAVFLIGFIIGSGTALADSPETLDRLLRDYIKYLETTPHPDIFKSSNDSEKFGKALDAEREWRNKIMEVMHLVGPASLDVMEKRADLLMRKPLRPDSHLILFWRRYAFTCLKYFPDDGVARIERYLMRDDVPLLVKAWTLRGIKLTGKASQVDESVCLLVCEKLLHVRDKAMHSWGVRPDRRTGSHVENRNGVEVVLKTWDEDLSIGWDFWYTGREYAVDFIWDVYGRPEEIQWPRDWEGGTPGSQEDYDGSAPEVQAKRETAAVAAEKWIEGRLVKYRERMKIFEAIENHRDKGLTEREQIRDAFAKIVDGTDRYAFPDIERLMNLLLAEVDRKDRDEVFLPELADAIKTIIEKNNVKARSASAKDLKDMVSCRKWLGELIKGASERPMSYFNKREWETMAERLSIMIEQ